MAATTTTTTTATEEEDCPGKRRQKMIRHRQHPDRISARNACAEGDRKLSLITTTAITMGAARHKAARATRPKMIMERSYAIAAASKATIAQAKGKANRELNQVQAEEESGGCDMKNYARLKGCCDWSWSVGATSRRVSRSSCAGRAVEENELTPRGERRADCAASGRQQHKRRGQRLQHQTSFASDSGWKPAEINMRAEVENCSPNTSSQAAANSERRSVPASDALGAEMSSMRVEDNAECWAPEAEQKKAEPEVEKSELVSLRARGQKKRRDGSHQNGASKNLIDLSHLMTRRRRLPGGCAGGVSAQRNLLACSAANCNYFRRPIVVLFLLAITLASLLATVLNSNSGQANEASGATKCTLINPCHALEINQQTTTTTTTTVATTTAAGGGPASSTPRPPIPIAKSYKSARLQQESTTIPTSVTLSAPAPSSGGLGATTARQSKQLVAPIADSSSATAGSSTGATTTTTDRPRPPSRQPSNRAFQQQQSSQSAEGEIVLGRRLPEQVPNDLLSTATHTNEKMQKQQQVPSNQIADSSSRSSALKLIASPSLATRDNSIGHQNASQKSNAWTLDAPTVLASSSSVDQASEETSPLSHSGHLLNKAIQEALNELVPGATEQHLSNNNEQLPSIELHHLGHDHNGRHHASSNVHQHLQRHQPGEMALGVPLETSHEDELAAQLANSIRQQQQQQQQQRMKSGAARIQATASQSAPSVALPPISHLLSPRNPFKLFASASAPTSTRYWPAMLGKEGHQAAGQSGPHQGQRPRGSAFLSLGRWLVPSSSPSASGTEQQHQQRDNNHQQQMAAGSGQQLASSPALHSVSVPFPSSLIAPMASSTITYHSGPSLYAHQPSAEQLEQLVRAASQAGHLPRNSPPILAAIVSSPNGQTFPGFYIPAIEQSTSGVGGEQESRVNEDFVLRGHRHQQQSDSHSMASSSMNSPVVSSGILSRIPGTDYVLHPEEVRAMMNIGELAWQRQRAHSAASSERQQQYVPSNGEQQQQQPQLGPPGGGDSNGWHYSQQAAGLMRENHAENARNYAYLDQTRAANSRPATSGGGEHMRGSHSQPEPVELVSQRGAGSASVRNASSLQDSLAKHLARSRANGLPALIRVNDQDYVHWPLIQFGGQHQQRPSRPFGDQQRQPSAQEMQFGASISTPSASSAPHNGHQHQLGAASVRVATQLTPGEIRQVEESILETLMLAQTMHDQKRIMDALALAAAKRPVAGQENRPSGGRWQQLRFRQSPAAQSGARSGLLFSRRRRRRRNSANQNKAQPITAPQKSLAALSSSQQFVGMLPSLGNPMDSLQPVATPLPALMLPASLASFSEYSLSPPSTDGASEPANQPGVEQRHQQQHQNQQQEPQAIESKVSARLPVLLADQETNKASIGPQSLAAESSSPEASVSPLQTHATSGRGHTQPQRRPHSADAAELLFGTRVGPLANNRSGKRPSSGGEQKLASNQPSSGQLVVGSENLRANQAAATGQSQSQSQPPSTSVANQFVTFVPIANNRDRQILLYKAGAMAGGSQPREAPQAASGGQQQAASRARPTRIHVDWPTMTSDADYFPPAPQPERGGSRHHHQGPAAEDHRPADSPLTGHSGRQLQQQQQPMKLRATSTQTKLQFAQDYQAREGVPIYNNNVRVAGALGRHRTSPSSLEAQLSPEVEPGEGAEHSPDSEESLESASDDERELQEDASSLSRETVASASGGAQVPELHPEESKKAPLATMEQRGGQSRGQRN